MSKYSHFEMCEKIFGNKYKYDKRTHDYIPYSRTDMWDKLLELQQENKQLKEQLEEKELEAIRWEEHFNNAKLDYKILEQENAVLKKALELACEDLSLYEDITTAQLKMSCYVKEAKEILK